MTSRAAYFRRRRLRLRRARLCTRCGLEPPEEAHTLCSCCLGIETFKKRARRETNGRKRRETGVLRRVTLLEQAAAALRARLDKVA